MGFANVKFSHPFARRSLPGLSLPGLSLPGREVPWDGLETGVRKTQGCAGPRRPDTMYRRATGAALNTARLPGTSCRATKVQEDLLSIAFARCRPRFASGESGLSSSAVSKRSIALVGCCWSR